MKTLDSINQELNRLFDLFNEHYYAGELVKPIVAVQSNGRKSRAMGWCTLQKIWKDQEQEQYYYEITIYGDKRCTHQIYPLRSCAYGNAPKIAFNLSC